MKKLVLLLASLLMGLTTVTASEFHHGKKRKHLNKTKHYRYVQPIVFIERGVEFLIFPDGSFDFNTNINDNYYRYNNYNRRNNVNVTFGAPNRYFRYNNYGNRGMSISHDRDGRVRRIGNVYLNYDRYGKIKRAGTVYMNYNRGNGRLNQVGGLSVDYNRWGEIVRTHGRVNRFNDYQGIYSRDMDHPFKKHKHRYDDDCDEDDDWYDDDDIYYNDDQYYYYKQNGKVKKHLKRK
ncbi:hypothetical protein [Seonamhaeicola sp.]|uniref:hypothetical protein n=1 Tax=Seonamhaeicola sp. TaxID=1912245 RepID=UPI00261A0E85|nr:hypothetical protein [Seonamhaeicola sp.]